MHRFYLPPNECHPPLLTLTGSEAHHAKDVLRLERGEEVIVLDGAGRQFTCEVRDLDRHYVTLAVLQTNSTPPPHAQITLLQAIPKGKLFESIIQKATELGVARIVPLLSERVATRLEGNEVKHKAEKWRQVAVEAVKQCGQTWLPVVDEPVKLPDWLVSEEKFDLALVGSLAGDGRHPRPYFAEFAAAHGARPKSVAAWIGPEGDFTAEELALIRQSGARPISLGPLVLRSETAALYTLAAINYELQAP